MITLLVLSRLLGERDLIVSANTIPHDPLSIFFFVGFPLVSVLGLMSGTYQMTQAHSAPQGRFMRRLTAFTAFAASVVFLMLWVFLFFQMK
jgi:hypothetical protein